jgi:hypothetical protein
LLSLFLLLFEFAFLYAQALTVHFFNIYFGVCFPKPNLTSLNMVTLAANQTALANTLSLLFNPSRFGLLHFFFSEIGEDLRHALTEKEIKVKPFSLFVAF